MTKVLLNSDVHSAIFRNGTRILKLGALAALTMFSGNVFRTAGNSFIQSAYDDYKIVRSIFQEGIS